MRKRILIKRDFFGRMWMNIFTCTGKKLIKLAPVIVMAIALSACSHPKTSWEVYCETYNVDVNNPSEEEENYYLDCWVGSAEEEFVMGGNQSC